MCLVSTVNILVMKQDGLCLCILIYYTGHWAGIKQSPAQITKGQSKLFPWRLKGGSGNKTHSHPLTIKMIHVGPRNQKWSGNDWWGGQNLEKLTRRKNLIIVLWSPVKVEGCKQVCDHCSWVCVTQVKVWSTVVSQLCDGAGWWNTKSGFFTQ